MRNTTIIRSAAFAALTASMTLTASQSVFAQTADIVFTNADVRTMDDANPKAQAVAITGNKITYVGDAAATVLLTMMDGKITYTEPSIATGALDDPKIRYPWQQ